MQHSNTNIGHIVRLEMGTHACMRKLLSLLSQPGRLPAGILC
jgi:hypothetical protein